MWMRPSQTQDMVVSSRYCVPHPVDLAIVRKVTLTSNSCFDVTDLSDNIVFKVKKPRFWHRNLSLLDAAGNPILTLKPKSGSRHHRWKAYRGESTDEKDLLFSVKLTSLIRYRKTKLNVFLANNTQEERCDFRIEAKSLLKSCVIYAGDSNTTVAQMERKWKLFRKDKFVLNVCPNTDSVFVTAITVILDEIINSGG